MGKVEWVLSKTGHSIEDGLLGASGVSARLLSVEGPLPQEGVHLDV